MNVLRIEWAEKSGTDSHPALESVLRRMPASRRVELYRSHPPGHLCILAPEAGQEEERLLGDLAQLHASGLLVRPVQRHRLEEFDALHPVVPPDAYFVFAMLPYAKENREEILRLLAIMMESTRKEPGCFMYDLYETKGGGAFWMLEAYRDEESLATHKASTYYSNNVPLIAASLSAPIQPYRRLFF